MKIRITAEHGSALVTALLLTMIMLTVGLAGLAQVDVQQEQSGTERVRETSFNLGEGVLNAQIFALSQNWRPLRAADAAPVVFVPCDQDSSEPPNCPDRATIKGLFASPDTAGPTAWSTEIRDNDSNPTRCPTTPAGASTFYSDHCTEGLPAYDLNADDQLWVRAQATVRGRTRAMVARVQVERVTHELPRSALLAGSLQIGNNGKKVMINAKAETTLSTEIKLRCDPIITTICVVNAQTLTTVLGTDRLAEQLYGTTPELDPDAAAALPAEDLERLKQTAITNGTYYATCPDIDKLVGAVIYVETCNESYQGNAVINAPGAPGALIIARGSIAFRGTVTYNGIVYHRNLAEVDTVLVELSGNNGGANKCEDPGVSSGVSGGVFIDGKGAFKIDGSACLKFNGKAINDLRSYGSAGIIQNTWREITPGP